MIWLSIRLSQLPLETLYWCTNLGGKKDSQIQERPLAVISQNKIICVNTAAYEQGIRVMQSSSSAYALCDELQLHERNRNREVEKLKSLALILYRYSPDIVIDEDGFLIVEIGRSLRLFDQLTKLIEYIASELDSEAIKYHMAIGHTPKSAKILSFQPASYSIDCYSRQSRKIMLDKLKIAIGNLSIRLLDLPKKNIEQIASVGITLIREIKEIPPAKITKRFGKVTSLYLAKMFAESPDPQVYFTPAEKFSEKIEFIDPIHHRQGLYFPIKHLLKNLTRFLMLQQKSCQSLEWRLCDTESNEIGFEVLTSHTQINAQVYFELTQLNLERYILHAPIYSIELCATKLTPLNLTNQSLFSENETFNQNTDFINKIRAKLGSQSCYSIQQRAEHVPELAHINVSEVYTATYNGASSKRKNNQISLNNTSDKNATPLETKKNLTDQNLLASRPSWLLNEPEPIYLKQQKLIYKGELTIISSQERVTSYWWKKKVARDYYLAEHSDGRIYWIFYDQIKRHWFLHGIYS